MLPRRNRRTGTPRWTITTQARSSSSDHCSCAASTNKHANLSLRTAATTALPGTETGIVIQSGRTTIKSETENLKSIKRIVPRMPSPVPCLWLLSSPPTFIPHLISSPISRRSSHQVHLIAASRSFPKTVVLLIYLLKKGSCNFKLRWYPSNHGHPIQTALGTRIGTTAWLRWWRSRTAAFGGHAQSTFWERRHHAAYPWESPSEPYFPYLPTSPKGKKKYSIR